MEKMSNRIEDLINMKQHFSAVEQFKKLENFWIGPDVSLDKKITIPPLSIAPEVNIIVSKTDFPSVDINRDSLSFLDWSVRSCLAQSGTEVLFNSFSLSDDMLKRINEGENVSIPVAIINHANRPVELEGGVIRFFWANIANRLTGDKLHEALKSDVKIEGEEGKDWSYLKSDPEMTSSNEDICLRLPIKEKYYIPDSEETLKVKSKKDLISILKEIPKDKEIDFKIGETAKVKLGPNVIAVINTGGYPDGESHIHSPLIDPGFEGEIRTETVYGLKYIEIFLHKI
jgi:hypothetical protein